MFVKSPEQIRNEALESQNSERAHQLTSDFLNMIDTWLKHTQPYDPDIDKYILETKLHAMKHDKGFDGKRYFTPSSAGSCKRELYHRMIGDKKDKDLQPSHQELWKQIGTSIGEIIQRNLLFITKHYEKLTGEKPPFKPEFINFHGMKVPAWEEFAKKQVEIKHKNHNIPIQGQPDGILIYKDGTRIGLEVKSKQTSPSKTSSFSMKEAEAKHKMQVIAYGPLYDVDEYLIFYVNAAKQSWFMSDEDLQKYPDRRCFYEKITDEKVNNLLDQFVEIMTAVENKQPPKLDVSNWAFNNYKTAIAKSMTVEEVTEIEQQLHKAQAELKAWNPTGKQKKPPAFLTRRAEELERCFRYILEKKGIEY